MSSSSVTKDFDVLLKLLLIGDSSVGKTCLLMRFVEDYFTTNFISTIGIDFKVRTVKIDGKRVKLQIWDTAGQEQYRTITTAYYRGAVGICLVYDVTSQQSFEDINEWLRLLGDHAAEAVPKILIGNKSDMNHKRVISESIGMQLARQCDASFYECSAKTGANVEAAFMELAGNALRFKQSKSDPNVQGAVPLDPEVRPESQAGKKCC